MLLSSDRSSDVRKEIVDVFIKALDSIKEKNSEQKNALFEFMEDITSKICLMTHDFDTKVSISAIKVATILVQYEQLTEDEKNKVSKLVMNENPEIRKAAL